MKLWKVCLSLLGVGVVGGILWADKKAVKRSEEVKKRYKGYYNVVNQWLRNKNENRDVVSYFINNNFSKIAIYGMGEMGNRLYEELRGTDIKVAYFIDKNAEEIYYSEDDIPVIGLDDIENQEKVDAIIVTPIYDFDSIEEALLERSVEAEIISLEDIIYEV